MSQIPLGSIVVGAPTSARLARFMGIPKQIAEARDVDADVRGSADRVNDLASAARSELVGVMKELDSLKRLIGQGRLF